jgi:serine/threonine-protein kinase
MSVRDEQLASLLAEMADQARQGHSPDLDVVSRRHPDLSQELRELWPVFLLAEGLARPENEPANVTLRIAARDGGPSPSPVLQSFGDYEMMEELGRGGMGIVYKARQRSLNRIVALKMLLRGELASGVDVARFRAEAESAARLDHPHIVPVYEVGQHEEQDYFTMQYVEGTTLARRVAAGPLSAREAAHCLAPVCRALHHAHQKGVLHRDLKPSNVLLDREGRPYVTDFGLAKRVEGGGGLTRSGAVLGTPSYMPPEQAAGSRGTLGPASDIYSLGAILYELLTGRPPFQAATPLDTLLLVLEQEPVPPRLLNRQVDRDLEMICLKCLQKPASLRYANAADFAADLEAFLAGEPISVRSGGLTSRITRLLGETHHAAILENWGLLWMWHSLAILVLCSLTNILFLQGVQSVYPYLGIWGVGFGTWASIFWALRRRAGPITFVERQIAHVWLASTLGSISLFGVELLLGLPVLTLSPVLAILGGMVFLVKAGVLSGWFYLPAAASFVTAALMAVFPGVALFLFGLVSAAGFFIPGVKYYRQRGRATAVNRPGDEGVL